MIDREARDRFAQAIRALVAGTITNDQFEDIRLPSLNTADPAIAAIYQEGAWHLYSDLEEHRLRGKHALSPKDKSHVARWVLFLKTDLPYEWPELRGMRFFALGLANLFTFGLANRFYANWFKQQGEVEVWPFIRQADYAAALERPVYLGVASNNSFKPMPLRGTA
ncbi:hypothetical protein [Nitrosomonas eutropha]|uniref:Uncharacterized protein n=2 Tax=Nitrosomonas eutropha TaxID=916 RepID=A0ABX5M6L5_9PROT|nr:hypothetical protein [Nitrosomonas eutropha]ABI59616.1 hypothetical protein Neut_1368 [Nitrosomonas eutropha C91]PXV79834.1 hypothetical protein C8R14_12045 [Nitrosomonas eutropha]SEJ24419.1 hypothetical protein SAMN05216318_1353 [Nitrosomonas eutropha]